MLTFQSTPDGYVFCNKSTNIAVGVYEPNGFAVLYKDNVLMFVTPMQAFTFLNNEEFPSSQKCLKPQTQALFNKLKI